MPRVSAGSIGPGWGCTCPSNLKKNQILKGMANASSIETKYMTTEPDGTMVFHAYGTEIYRVTFNPQKPGKVCKHAIACSAYVVGDWLTTGLVYLRGEMEECRENRKTLKSVTATVTRLEKKLAPPSST